MQRRVQQIIGAVALAGTCFMPGGEWFTRVVRGAGGGGEDPIITGVRQGEETQKQIVTQTRHTAEELGAIIAEFEASGLGDSADVTTLKAIQKALGQLSRQQMADVLTALAAARQQHDAGAIKSAAVRAFTDQKTIVVEFQKILAEYERQQELIALSLRLSQLADRQQNNWKAAKAFYKETRNLAVPQYNESQRTRLQVQTAEQEALRDEVATLLAKLAQLSQRVDAATAEKLKRALEQAQNGKLEENLRQTSDNLKNGRIITVISQELQVRDLLRELSQLVAPVRSPQDILRDDAERLARLSLQEQQVQTGAAALAGTKEEQAQKAAQLEERQSDLVDGTDQLRKDLGEVAAAAKPDLEKAQLEMQLVRKGLNEKSKEEAVKHSQAAQEALNAAWEKLVAAAARLEKLPATPEAAKPEQLAELRDRVRALRVDQEKLQGDTRDQKAAISELSGRQGGLLRADRDLALAVKAEAAKALQEAGRQMDQAQISLGTTGNRAEASAAQQAAITDLKSAEQRLDAAVKKQEQAKQDLEKLEAARDKVAQALVDQQQIASQAAQNAARGENQPQQTSAKAGDKKDPQTAEGKPPKSAPAKNGNTAEPQTPEPKASDHDPAETPPSNQALAEKQAENNKQTAAAQKEIGAAAKEATDALDKAQQDMQGSKESLQKGDAKEAAPKAREAKNDLYKAKEALDQKIADLAEKLGKTPDHAEDLAKLAKALDQAQHEVGEHMEKPEAGAMHKAGAHVAKAAAEDKGAAPHAAREAMKEAEKALEKAAAAAGAGEEPGAKAEAHKAQESIAQAQAAVAMAQAGLQAQAKSGPPESSAAEPGHEAGHEPGQKSGTQAAKHPGNSNEPSKADEKSPNQSSQARKDDKGQADVGTVGGGKPLTEPSASLRLPPRDRAAIQQSQREGYSQEYGPQIEQYLKNLSDQAK